MKSVFDIAKEIHKSTSHTLSSYATSDDVAFRKYSEKKDRFRPPFALDRDRIIYSGAFRRYTGKTQVVYFASMLDEQLSSRSIHTLYVAQIARTIGRLLRLNLDLIEAIALGHDLGHPPFGHDGEKYLSKVCEEQGIGQFHHNIQSLRVVDKISKRGIGLNLTFQVRDGLLSHDGEIHEQKIVPNNDKREEDLQNYIELKEKGVDAKIFPMTIEACVVRLADTIAYIGQDFEDAIRLGIVTREQLPENCKKMLGKNNGEIIETLVKNTVENSYDKSYICLGKRISDALFRMKKFNYKYIYNSQKLKINHDRISKGFEILFSHFLKDITGKNKDSSIYKDFLNQKSESYRQSTPNPVKVKDYLAGMTDRYFTYILQKIIVPDITLDL